MLSCIALFIHDLMVHPPSKDLQNDLKAAIDQYYLAKLHGRASLAELAREYEGSGVKLLSVDEILEEVAERRGGIR